MTRILLVAFPFPFPLTPALSPAGEREVPGKAASRKVEAGK